MDWSIGTFGGLRLDKGASIFERIVLRKTTCLKRLGGDRAGEESIGRFFANPKVTAAKIVESVTAQPA